MQHTSEGHKNTHNPLQLKVSSQQQHPVLDHVYWCNWSLEKYRITISIKIKTAFEALVIGERAPPPPSLIVQATGSCEGYWCEMGALKSLLLRSVACSASFWYHLAKIARTSRTHANVALKMQITSIKKEKINTAYNYMQKYVCRFFNIIIRTTPVKTTFVSARQLLAF